MESVEERIGQAAGEVWQVLSRNGIMTEREIHARTGLPESVTNQGIGWLAREGKIELGEPRRAETTFALCEPEAEEACAECEGEEAETEEAGEFSPVAAG